MGKISSVFKGGIEKFKGLSTAKKAAYIILTLGIIVSLFFIGSYATTTKYEVLFSNMDSTDSGNVIAKLKEKKTTYQIKGNSILVPKDQVDQLRMELMSEVTFTNGSKGWELLDNTSQLGTTDEQMKLNYQRALQGELERTIKTFPQIESSRVILVPAEDSAFVKDTTEATASVALKLKSGQTLTKQQVAAIISLVSGSTKNLPKTNVQVVDSSMKTLSNGIFKKDDGTTITEADNDDETAKRQSAKSDYEKKVEDKIYNQLEPIYKDGIRVNVNADLDFDSNQSVATIYGNNQVVSEHNIKETTTPSTTATGGASPIDNNMTNTTTNTTGTGTSTTHDENTKNYEVSKTESKTIKAPGDVKKLTASVVLNGNVDDNTKAVVKNLVINAMGFDEKRGDSVTIESLPFDTTSKTAAQKAVTEMNKAAADEKKNALYKEIGIGAGAALILLMLLIAFKKRNKKDEGEEEDIVEFEPAEGVLNDSKEDTIVMPDGSIVPANEVSADSTKENANKLKTNFKPIELDVENEQTHLEKELRKYALEKPDQVSEIIKSWLANDER